MGRGSAASPRPKRKAHRIRSRRSSPRRRTRHSFRASAAPEDAAEFAWGVATSAWQIEGASDQRGLCVWDHARCRAGYNAAAHVDNYAEDVARLEHMDVNAYRFSIAWTRLWPDGDALKTPQPEGVEFYRALLRALRAKGIRATVTLFHWDYPLALEQRGGWMNPCSVRWFETYAMECEKLFGDMVDSWITFNEPWTYVVHGHCTNAHAPFGGGDVYRIAHHILLAHARAYRTIKRRHHARPVYMSLNVDWLEPASAHPGDAAAQLRALAYTVGWFADPVFHGDYPSEMRTRLGDRLPRFDAADRIKGTCDCMGLNYYSAQYVSSVNVGSVARAVLGPHGMLHTALKSTGIASVWGAIRCDYFRSMGVVLHALPGAKTTMGWAVAPWGLTRLLLYLHARYAVPIVITENGVAVSDADPRGDLKRISFVHAHLAAVLAAMDHGVQVNGYYLWSLLDNVEWMHGTTQKFGAFRVDFDTMQRHPRPVCDFYRDTIRASRRAGRITVPPRYGDTEYRGDPLDASAPAHLVRYWE